MFPNGMILNETYEIRERIGHGGGGAVYAAYDIKLRKLVAIKYLHLEGDHAIKAFGHEASLLANLHHPSLPKVYLHFSTSDGQFLVMDLIDGDDLSTLLERQGGPLPVDQVLGWADQLLSVLTYLHSYYRQPIVHRDIKPANIKITTRGELKLLDFGLAKAEIFTNMRSAMHSVHGYTLTYAPPEQINQEGTDPRSDLYSLGATLYHLLTGRTPTDGDGKTADALARTLALAKRKPDPIIAPKLLNPAIPEHVNQAIMRSLEIDADERFASAEEFRQVLAQPYTPINPAQTQILPTTIRSRAITGPPKQASIRESSQPQLPPISPPKSNYPAQSAPAPSVQAQPKASAKRFLPLLLGLLLVAAGGGWWLSRDEQTPIVTVSQATHTVVAAQPSQGMPTITLIESVDRPTLTLAVATSEPTNVAEDLATATEQPVQPTTAAAQPTNEPATARPAVQPTNRPATARPVPTNPPALQPTNPPVVVQPTNEPVVQPTNQPAPSDRDGDGFFDESDGCPDVAGPNNGCPAPVEPTQPPAVTDRDGDTIPDDRDACPNEPGDPSRNGCPKPAEQPTSPPPPTAKPEPTRVPPTVAPIATNPPPPPPTVRP